MIATTVSRVPAHTPEHLNARIRRGIAENVAMYANAGPEAISVRLDELDREWDIERMLEANASTITLTGCLLGLSVNRSWFLLPTVVSGFLLQHALQGWCPPITWFRRMGFRTASEIDYERYALKALRGDFADLPQTGALHRGEIEEVLERVRR